MKKRVSFKNILKLLKRTFVIITILACLVGLIRVGVYYDQMQLAATFKVLVQSYILSDELARSFMITDINEYNTAVMKLNFLNQDIFCDIFIPDKSNNLPLM